MNKEFVPYELALKLKELGFDETCFGYWNIDPYLPNPTFNLVKPFDHEWCIPAPLYQQAFRWFREKYGLQHDITLTVDGSNQLVGFYILIHKLDPLLNEDQSIELEVNTTDREEAELECLTKLIEIVEQQKQK